MTSKIDKGLGKVFDLPAGFDGTPVAEPSNITPCPTDIIEKANELPSAVDAEADTQQFVLPITIPLILSFLLIQNIMDNPDGSLAFWMSIIPFTSPVIMMVRLPFGVDSFDLFLSMITLIISFIIIAWIASKIYRVGILMYGKKASYKEIWKWIRY